MRFLLYTLSLLAALCWGCSRTPHYSEPLLRAHRLADTGHPDSALCLLDSLCATPGALEGKPEQMYADLLLVKAGDKAYHQITSDSAIIPLLEYYVKGKGDPALKPLTLYYAGRTYRELGDAPRALDYFQQALDAIPQGEDQSLRSYIHAQKADIFSRLNLDREALDEMKKSLLYSLNLNDTVGHINDHISIANFYAHVGCLDSATINYNAAYELSEIAGYNYLKGAILCQMAAFHLDCGELEMADSLFTLSQEYPIDISSKSAFHSTGASLQLSLGNEDKVQPHIKWLRDSGMIYAKRFAYWELVKYNLKHGEMDECASNIGQLLLYTDSIRYNEGIEAIVQMNAVYNYSLRERENERLLQEKFRLERNLTIIIGLTLIIIIITFLLLRKAYIRRKEFTRLRQELSRAEQRIVSHDKTDELSSLASNECVISFLEKAEIPSPKFKVSEWRQLETEIKNCCPRFYIYFRNGNVLTDIEWKIVMLMKIGLSTNKIASVLNRTDSSISTTKSRLSRKLQGSEKNSAKDLNALINSL